MSRLAIARAAVILAVVVLAMVPVWAGPVRLEIDPDVSEVAFTMRTTWHKVEGRTQAISGAVTSESGDILADGRASVSIEAAALDTRNRRRDRSMRETYLETAKHPAITFVSTSSPVVKLAGAILITGQLSIHGVTRSVELRASVRQEGGSWIVTGELPVRWSDHGIADPSIPFNRVQDEVLVRYKVRLTPSAGQR